MKWSVSGSRIFFQCPRRWYYETVFANSRAKDPARKEAFILKQLQNVYAWRGKLVDQVISNFVVPKLNLHETVKLNEVLDYAHNLFEAQLAFATARRYREPNIKKSDEELQEDYCALFELEYDGAIDQKVLRTAESEIVASLTNFLNSRFLAQIIQGQPYLIAQRPIQFPFADVNVQCTLDLIAFFEDTQPVVVDWKVQAPKHKEHFIQLGTYAFALSLAKPHKDFPTRWLSTIADPTKIGLIEFQLLRNKELTYSLTEEDIVEIEDYVYKTSNRIQLMLNGNDTHSARDPTQFPKARSSDACMWCKFKKMCWREVLS
jgi:hypothetical protein